MSRFAGKFGEMNISQCVFCRHARPGSAGCDAFPGGIPGPILLNQHDHRKPYEGDNGIRFEPRLRVVGD